VRVSVAISPPRSHPLADGGDFTGAFDARQIRRLRATGERAAGLRDVDKVDAGGGDPDQDLARARRLPQSWPSALTGTRPPAVSEIDEN
jgi:hypothetical protein